LRQDHPDWSPQRLEDKAHEVSQGLMAEDRTLYNNDRRFRRHNMLTPNATLDVWGQPHLEDDD
jgi:hypothetical protein